MKRYITLFFVLSLLFSQSSTIKSVFKSTRLINISTTEQLYAKTFEYRIGHRFGDASSGLKDFFGMDLGANTLLGLDFGLTDNIKAGFSRANRGKNYGFNGQYRLLSQERESSFPFSLSLVGSINYLSQDQVKEMYYLGDLLISHKVSPDFSAQISPYFIQVAESKDLATPSHNAFGMAISARYKITMQTSLVIEWSPMFNRDDYNKKSATGRQYDHDSFAMAYNIEAAGHTFQIIMSNTQEASMITSRLGSVHAPFSKHFYIGFNITRLFLLYDEEL